MKKYVMGIDVGTTGSKAMVVDLKGNIIGQSYKDYPLSYPHPGWAELDADILTNAVFIVVREAIEASKIDAADIASIGFSVQRSTVAFTDENDEALENTFITWMDTRADGYLKEIGELLDDDDHAEATGMPPCSIGAYNKIYWLYKERPEFIAKAKHMVTVDGYMMRKFGSVELCNERTSFQVTGVVDVKTMDISCEVCKRMGYERRLFPKLVNPGEVVGTVSSEVAKLTGLTMDTLIVAGSGDQQCGAVGSGLLESGAVSITLGTGGFVVVGVDKPNFRELKGLMVLSTPHLGVFEAEAIQSSGATCYRWAKETFYATEAVVAMQRGDNPYDDMDKLCEQSRPGANGVVYHAGLFGTSYPTWNPGASATFVGLKPTSTRGDILRAVMEGITLESRFMLEAIKNTGVETKNIYTVTGGATKCGVWRQIMADVLNTPIRTLEVEDAAVIGAAGLAAMGAGIYKTLDEVVENMVHFGENVNPIPENVKIYKKVYEIYKKVYNSLNDNGIYEMINELYE